MRRASAVLLFPANRSPLERIIMYSTTWCPDCRRAKDFLKRRGIEFDE